METAGHPVWVDRENIRGGHLWHEEIVQALETCPVFILALSPNSVASDNVRRELDLALGNKMLILPLMIKPTQLSDAMKYQLAGLQYIDIYSDYQAGFESLMNSLGVKGITPQSVTSPLLSRPHPSSSFLQRNRSMLIGGRVFILIILAALIFVPP